MTNREKTVLGLVGVVLLVWMWTWLIIHDYLPPLF